MTRTGAIPILSSRPLLSANFSVHVFRALAIVTQIATILHLVKLTPPHRVAEKMTQPAKEGTVEEWGRSPKNPVGGWYGLKKGLRGRFGMYIPPLMEKLGLAELTHEAKGNRMKAK